MGKRDVYEEALSELKAEGFDPAALLTVGGYLVKMLAAWPRVTTWVERPEAGEKIVPGVYIQIGSPMHPAWEMTRIDFAGWAQLAQVGEDAIWKAWQGLARMNLIYPDNTVPDEVRRFLTLQAEDLLRIT